jgi:hypothetical protein
MRGGKREKSESDQFAEENVVGQMHRGLLDLRLQFLLHSEIKAYKIGIESKKYFFVQKYDFCFKKI